MLRIDDRAAKQVDARLSGVPLMRELNLLRRLLAEKNVCEAFVGELVFSKHHEVSR